jgi:type II secretory pathway component GspD/PulD (secretin)
VNNFFPNLYPSTFPPGVPAKIQARPGDSKIMKNMSPILLAGLIAGWFASTASAAPQDAAPQPPPAQTAQPATPDTNAPPAAAPAANPTNAAPALRAPGNPNADLTAGTADQGLTLNLRGVSVDKALAFLTDSVGFTINRQTSTRLDPSQTVDLVSTQPLSKEELVPLFNKVLADHGLTAVQDKNTLTIMTLEMAQNNAGTPVIVLTNSFEEIPQDSQVVTEVIPVHSLNPTQAIKDLYTLIPEGVKMNSNEAGNAIIMTGRQADIRRFAQIIKAIDSTGNGDLQVFLLTYADSKAIAAELKDVFTDQSAAQGGGNPFAAFIGRRGGGGGAAAANPDESKRAAVHVNAVSDDQNNAVLVSAPADFMPGISNIIWKLDIPQEDTVQIRLFTLRNADCTDVSTELLALFPDPNLQANQNQGRGNRGAAVFGGGFGGRGGAASAGAGMSDRLKKQVTVNAVPDPRTQSVLVTASKDTMIQIEHIIDEMDAMDNGHVSVHVVYPTSGDVMDMLAPLQTLFPTPTGSASSTSTQMNALQMRMQQAAQQNNFNTSSSSGMGGSSSGRLP